jgi:hypothetical protein
LAFAEPGHRLAHSRRCPREKKVKKQTRRRRSVKLSEVDLPGGMVERNRFESTLSIQLTTEAIWETLFPKAIVKTA